MDGLVFYDCATAPSPRRARMVIAEKGLTVEARQVDLRSGEHFFDAFRAINPRCTVPALDTGEGVVLTDNASIAAYLEAIRPDPPLLGVTPVEKALIAEWINRTEFEGLMGVAEAFRNSAPGFKGRALTGPDNYDQIPALAERGRARVAAFYPVLERRLADSPYLGGDQFSIADITAFVFVEFAARAGVEPEGDFPAMDEWRGAIRIRPSASA
ncbi:glutathione S-transferase family protein [Hyphobacterium marinum]|uniref:Glutathione S-transferase n=1 Tax=Hyphobacterium marinum TaxID=3116574 RepID=A0ABU7LZX7_9PROT|nr:glutathione S-transferase [Hyphobacterium sp. Y6023]MEE2567099.1 glutathione S-transferase [Hyphobacterium sp. Y6023]